VQVRFDLAFVIEERRLWISLYFRRDVEDEMEKQQTDYFLSFAIVQR
jgi:hypothetical protein